MVQNKTKIPDGWQEVPLNQVCENFDNLRRPVSQNLREPGDVPYYWAILVLLTM